MGQEELGPVMRVRILDFDGSLVPQRDLFPPIDLDWIAAREQGPRIRLACTSREYQRFRRWLADSASFDHPTITFYGSGDFHHVTLALLERLPGPFNLLVLDKHPDWMRGVPFVHCGTWLHHALRLPNLKKVFHSGGELDFDNAYRLLAPWHELRSGRVVVFPARRVYVRGGWKSVPVRPLIRDSRPLEAALREALAPFHEDLARHPLYVSIDKDVLVEAEAAVNWDSGLLNLADAFSVLDMFLEAAGRRLAGADVLGDWSPIKLGTFLNWLCHRLDHPSPVHDPGAAARRNGAANAEILRWLRTNPAASKGPPC
jgi:hypothetical protein